jgi:alpha-tubulin suppressor-like RCC1 family protein
MTTCGTTAAGVFCWCLPIPSNVPQSEVGRTSPTQIYAQTGLSPIGISVGYRHVCAQWVSGSYRETNCWGYDWSGQTGAPWAPYSLLGQGPNVGTEALRVAAQGTFTCVDQPIGVVCFGAGCSGQLGSSTIANTHLPQQVGGFVFGGPPMALHGVSTGQYHACALDPNGYAYCWGGGAWGQLGHGLRPDGYADSSSMPVAVTGGRRFKSLAAGERHTCGIGVDNLIYCWGSNYYGELGTQYKSAGQPYTNGWVADPVATQPPI